MNEEETIIHQNRSPQGWGVGWLRFWVVLTATSPVLFALWLLAGLSPGTKAQATHPTISPTEIYEGETLEFTMTLSSTQGMAWDAMEDNIQGGSGTVAVQQTSSGGTGDWYFAEADGTWSDDRIDGTELSPIQNDDGTYSLGFHVHATADSDTSEGDENLTIVLQLDSTEAGNVTFTLKEGARPAPTDGVTITPTSLALEELGTSSTIEKTYTVVLDTNPTADVTITVDNGDSTAVAVDTNAGTTALDTTLTFTAGGDGSGSGAGNGNWAVARTVTVRALNDADATNESFNITHMATTTGSTGPYHTISINPVAVTTMDADHGVVVSEASLTVMMNEDNTYMVALKSDPGGTVEIAATIQQAPRGIITVSPTTLTFTSSDWYTPQTVTVTGDAGGTDSITHEVSTATTDYPTAMTIPAVSVRVTPIITIAPLRPSIAEGGTIDLRATYLDAGQRQGFLWCLQDGADAGTATYSRTGPDYGIGSYGGTRRRLENRCAYGLRKNPRAPGKRSSTLRASLITHDDAIDEPDETIGLRFTIYLDVRGTENFGYTIIDNDPTIVSLARVGSGAVALGETVEFTVTLGRALVAGEVIDVPLSIGGMNVTTGNWSLAAKGGDSLNTGVTLSSETTTTPKLTFAGAGAQIATLEWTATADNLIEENPETVTIALGPDGSGDNGFDSFTDTNVGGGADPHSSNNQFDVGVNNPIIIIQSGGSTVVSEAAGAGHTDTYTVALNSAPTANVILTAKSDDTGAATVSPATLTFTSTDYGTAQTVTVTGVDDDIDNMGDERTAIISHGATSSDPGYVIPQAGSLSVTVTDDDQVGVTVSPVSLALTELGAASDVEKTYTVVLNTDPTADVTITITNGNGSAVAVDSGNQKKDILTFTHGNSGNWNTPPDGDGAGAERW